MDSAISRIALVGHCGFDAGSLRRFAQQHAPGAAVIEVFDDSSLQRIADGATLLLINRVLDGSFDAADGVALIRAMRGRPDGPRAILISNYADAQAAAVEAGAHPGFGKSELSDPAAAQRFKDAMT